MPAAKFQVFVSSTFEDLKVERDQVIKAVLEMGHIPVGMEMFSAADEEQWQIIARHIDESDYYAVIVAHRYGSVTEEGVSYTRKEYEYARSQGIPCLGFIIDEEASWPSSRQAQDDLERERLASFKSLVRQKPVNFWRDGQDLHSKFSISLMKSFTSQPREGWVRSSANMGPEAAAEVVRLSAENANLRQQLTSVKGASAQERQDLIRETGKIMTRAKTSLSYRHKGEGAWLKAEVSFYRVFEVLAPELIVDNSIRGMSEMLAMHIREDKEKVWDIVALNQVKILMSDLMTLDLVQPSTRRHPVSDTGEYWALTTLGMDVLKYVRRYFLEERAESIEEPQDGSSDDQSTDGGETLPEEPPTIKDR